MGCTGTVVTPLDDPSDYEIAFARIYQNYCPNGHGQMEVVIPQLRVCPVCQWFECQAAGINFEGLAHA